MPARSDIRKGKPGKPADAPPPEAPKRGAGTRVSAKKPPVLDETAGKAAAGSPGRPRAKAGAAVEHRMQQKQGKVAGRTIALVGPAPKARVDVRLSPSRSSMGTSGVRTMSGTKAIGGERGEADILIRTSAPNGAGRSSAKRGDIASQAVYRPNEAEPFMNERQRTYFRNKLLAWREDIVRQNQETLQGLHEESAQFPDLTDRATSETDRALELRARDRQRKLMAKIDAALARIEEGTYGYCEETGEPISLKRLDARPIATMSLEAQEKKERMERVFRED